MGEKQDEKESEENMAKRAVVIQFRTDNAHIHAQIRIFSLKNIYKRDGNSTNCKKNYSVTFINKFLYQAFDCVI